MLISLSDHVSETRKAHLCSYESINKWAAIVKAVCNKRRRDKHCCEKVEQIPYPKFRDRESLKHFTTMLTASFTFQSAVCVCRKRL